MNLKSILIFSLVLLILSVSAISAADLNDRHETELLCADDNSLAVESLDSASIDIADSVNVNNEKPATLWYGSFGDLQKEVNDAPAGSTLYLERDYNGAEKTVVYINKNLTIDGQGHTIDCLGLDKCMAFSSEKGTIVLKNLKIVNGHNDAWEWDNNGGAIVISGTAEYIIKNCVFKNNYADDYGGAIYTKNAKNLTIINCLFVDNEADDACGGAIASTGKGGLIIYNSTFENNKAYQSGGAVCCYGKVTAVECYFNSNKAKNSNYGDNTYGGAIFFDEDSCIINSTFKDNYADVGGAISSKCSLSINWQNSTTSTSRFINNKAQIQGGAINCEAIFANNCLFEGNTADRILTSNGGAIFSTESALINNCTFKKNYADDYGGAIYARSAYINTVKTINQSGTSFFNENTANDDKGGAIYTTWSTFTLNAKFSGNKAGTYGGAIFAERKVETTNTTFFINEAHDDSGGAIYAEGEVVAVNAKFTGNRALVDGGAVYSKNNVKTTKCLFDRNRIDYASSNCYGGAIRAEGDVTIDNCTYQENYAEDYGGAIYAKNVYINTKQNKNQSFNSFFINNKAGDNDGGAIYAEGKISAKNTIFSKNTAVAYGGAVYAKDEVGFAHCIFESNKAGDNAGGAIYTKNDAVIDNSTFKKNWANKAGGAIYADIITLGNPSFFEYNTANKGDGGAIYANKFNNDVKNAVFIGNKAGEEGSYDGGAIYINKENHVTFSQCQFINNFCSDEGGAFYLDSDSSNLALDNNIFIGNSAKKGQAVFTKGTYKRINNNYWDKKPT